MRSTGRNGGYKKVKEFYLPYDSTTNIVSYKGAKFIVTSENFVWKDKVFAIGPIALATTGQFPEVCFDIDNAVPLSYHSHQRIPAKVYGEAINEDTAINFFRMDREKRLFKLVQVLAVGLVVVAAFTMIWPTIFPLIQKWATTQTSPTSTIPTSPRTGSIILDYLRRSFS
jgi:hypothetical protein